MESRQPGRSKILALTLTESELRQHPLEETRDLSLRDHESFRSHGTDRREAFPEQVRVSLPRGTQRSGRLRQHIPAAAVAWSGSTDGMQGLGFDVDALNGQRVEVNDGLGHGDREKIVVREPHQATERIAPEEDRSCSQELLVRMLRRAVPHDLLVGEVREVLERQAATVGAGQVKQPPVETDILKYRVTEGDSQRRVAAALGDPAEGIRTVRYRVGRQERPHRERRIRDESEARCRKRNCPGSPVFALEIATEIRVSAQIDQLGTGPRESQVRGIIASRALARVVRLPQGRNELGAATGAIDEAA